MLAPTRNRVASAAGVGPSELHEGEDFLRLRYSADHDLSTQVDLGTTGNVYDDVSFRGH